MNLFLISILVVLVPVVSQLTIGSNFLEKRTIYNLLSLLHINLLLILSYFGAQLVGSDAKDQGLRCGMPTVAYLFACFSFLVLLLLIIIAQLVIRHLRTKHLKK